MNAAGGHYELRSGGEGRRRQQNMAELKLRRLQELNIRLKEDLERRRIPVSEAADDLISFTDREPRDYMIPSKWGTPDRDNDPYAPPQQASCGCTIM